MFPILDYFVPGSPDTKSLESETTEINIESKSKKSISLEELVVKQV